MFKRKKPTVNNQPAVATDIKQVNSSNPYFNEIKGYLDLRSYDRVTIAAQRNAILLLIIVILFCIVGLIWIGKSSKFIPMVFYTDRNGSMVYGGIATEKLEISQPMVENQLARYIEGLRQVPTDLSVRTEYVRKVKMLSDTDVYDQVAVPTFENRYKDGAPNIYVTIRNIIPVDANTYQVDWDETANKVAVTTWKAMISFTMDNEIDDPQVRLYNPLGIQITGLNINQEIQK